MSNPVVIALNINQQTLRTLQVAWRSFPITGVAIAAGVALSILDIAQTNKADFIAIGRDTCFIVEAVILGVQAGQNAQVLNDPATLQYADMLVADLRYIEKRLKKIKGRSGLKKIFGHQGEQEMIRDCRERLTRTMMTLFCFQCNIEVHRRLANVHNLLVTILEASSRPPSPRIQPPPQWQIPSPSSPSTPSQRTQEMAATPSDPTGSPTGTGSNSFRNTQNYRSPSVGHALVVGDVNDTRDHSFNVIGTGNHIYISSAR